MRDGRPARIAILIDSLAAGGGERAAVEAAAALDPSRFLPHLVVTRQSGALEQLARDLGLGLTVLDRRRGFAPRKLLRAHSIVRESELVHAHLWGSAMWGALLARIARKPLLAHVQRYDADLSATWLPGYRYWVAPAAYRLVCVSNEIAESLRRGGLPASKLVVVDQGVSVGRALSRDAARAELGLDSAGTVIGIVARLRAEKRHDLALRSIAELRRRGHDAVLCAVGDGPEETRLRALTSQLGLDEAVRWAGARDDAGRLVRAFDVVLLTSSIEGMPLAALEAMVEGVPVVSTPAGAMPEVLAGGGGTIVDAADEGAIADALVATVGHVDPAERARVAERARAAYGVDRVARELEGLYEAALKRR